MVCAGWNKATIPMLPLSYNWHSLFVRKQSALLTFVVVATLVFVLSVLLSFIAGLRESVAASGSADSIIVLAPGATAESTSLILPEQVARLTQVEGVRLDDSGMPMLSLETYVQTMLVKKGSRTPAYVGVRGVDDIAFELHRGVRVVQGRRFKSGMREVIVGKAALARYEGIMPGSEVALGRLGNQTFSVVGVFEANGGALENEIWAPRTILADSYDRHFISSVYLEVAKDKSPAEILARITGPSSNLGARTESDYYEELLVKTREVVSLATFLVAVMSMGAIFAMANTMFAAVDGRRQEVAMLRTLGFGRWSIGFSFVTESFLLCAGATAIGLLGSIVTSGAPQDFLSDASWTAFAYERRVTPKICVVALGVSTMVGVLGALLPAWRATRIQAAAALRRI